MDISSLQSFYHAFYIDTPQGNNAFSFEQRFHKRIFVPPLVKGGINDVVVGDEIVFSDIDNGVEINARGLKHFVHIERPGQDIFIFDNHNHAFSFWAAGVAAGVIPMGSALVHVDQHKDTREPDVVLSPKGEGSQHFQYANNVLNVGNFIPPAVKLGWFKDVVQVGSAEAFELIEHDPLILDIDMDIFAPVMNYIPDELKIRRLREWMSRASYVTIATSPFFMDQPRAIELVGQLLRVETI